MRLLHENYDSLIAVLDPNVSAVAYNVNVVENASRISYSAFKMLNFGFGDFEYFDDFAVCGVCGVFLTLFVKISFYDNRFALRIFWSANGIFGGA